MSQLKLLVEELNAARKAFQEKALGLIKEEAKVFFEANPDITGVGWVQYAPYFNDGEPCEFNVHDISATTADPEEDEENFEEVYHGWGEGIVNGYGDSQRHEGAAEFCSMLQSVPDDVMEHIFGSHARVLITPKGISIEEYDHD